MTDKTDNKQDHQNTAVAGQLDAEATIEQQQSVPPATPSEPEAKQPEQPAQKKAASSGKVLAIVAIVIAIVLAAILYWHGHNQALAQAEQLNRMQAELQQQQSRLEQAEAAQSSKLAAVISNQNSTSEQLEGLSHKVLDLDSKRPNDWMLAEAEYLVRMAGRKLWLEQDAVSAAMMLANADERLAALND
ncbi:MAG: uroporphyrinogen-III C-methyltransferase, partial [Oceanisphaera sp.]|nr:uroporphyrinogen-III C-methyltransferase [Oceanisphaera sp.]